MRREWHTSEIPHSTFGASAAQSKGKEREGKRVTKRGESRRYRPKKSRPPSCLRCTPEARNPASPTSPIILQGKHRVELTRSGAKRRLLTDYYLTHVIPTPGRKPIARSSGHRSPVPWTLNFETTKLGLGRRRITPGSCCWRRFVYQNCKSDTTICVTSLSETAKDRHNP